MVERGRAVYGCFCSDYAHLGDVGHGQVGKTMNNLLLWINAVGLIEAGRLAETTGIDLVKLRDALLMSSGASDALKEWDMISFTWALKDMQIVADLTDKAGLSLPITGAIKELVKDARRIKATNAPNWTGTSVGVRTNPSPRRRRRRTDWRRRRTRNRRSPGTAPPWRPPPAGRGACAMFGDRARRIELVLADRRADLVRHDGVHPDVVRRKLHRHARGSSWRPPPLAAE